MVEFGMTATKNIKHRISPLVSVLSSFKLESIPNSVRLWARTGTQT